MDRMPRVLFKKDFFDILFVSAFQNCSQKQNAKSAFQKKLFGILFMSAFQNCTHKQNAMSAFQK